MIQFTHLFILTFFFCFNISAEFIDHLKKAPGKSAVHSMRNIDFIYMINLDRRTEKFRQASSELLRWGISPYRFSAVNGWELSVEALNEVGFKFQPGMTPLLGTAYPMGLGFRIASHEFMTEFGKTYFCHCMPPGAIGCALSHISVLKDAWDSGYETIWVMEDDIEAIGDPNRISYLIDELDSLVGKEQWDVLLTDKDWRAGVDKYVQASGAQKRPDMNCSSEERYSNKYTTNKVISQNFKQVSARFGTHSMIIRRSGIKKLLEFSVQRKIYLPYDMENYLPPGIKRYSFTFDLITNMLNPESDIGADSKPST
jgi:GR25 family glycosyltransferase involved in LPS biosynthesis